MAFVIGTNQSDNFDFSLFGTTENDFLAGLGGNDFLFGSEGNDTLSGGTGFDVALYSGGIIDQGINVNTRDEDVFGIAANTVRKNGGGTDILDGIDAFNLSKGGDLVFLATSDYSYTFDGAGDDTIEASQEDGAGAHDFFAGSGDDEYTGTTSWGDQIDFQREDGFLSGPRIQGVDVAFSAVGTGSGTDGWGGTDSFSGIETITGTEFGDTISGSKGNEYFDGVDGNDRLSGGGGDDTLLGGDGNDRLLGNAGDDSIQGGTSRDTLNGSNGNDVLEGERGADILVGGKGGDVLIGGEGDDRSSGGKGSDVFVLDLENGADTVTDFGKGGDLVDIIAFGLDFEDFEDTVQPALSQVGRDVALDLDALGGGGSVLFTKTTLSDFDSSVFVFV